MPALRLFYHIVRADFLERTRRYSFLVSLLVVIYMGYAVNVGQISFITAGLRSVMNSAWIGTQMALIVSTLFSLIGFYLVKNCVERDERTGVGQIIATTPVTSLQYLAGKWLSNMIVLTLIVGILCLAAVVMQILQSGITDLDWWALLSPILLISLPMMSVTAGLAVLFESMPPLRGGAGNLVFFLVWAFGLIGSISLFGKNLPEFEPFGLGIAVKSLTSAIQAISPGYTFQGAFFLGNAAHLASAAVSQTFIWAGIDWTVQALIGRGMTFFAPLLLVGLAAIYFDRFDPARNWSLLHPVREPVEEPLVSVHDETETVKVASCVNSHQPLETLAYRPVFASLVWQYLRLVWSGFPEWYYLVIGILWVGCLLNPANTGPLWLSLISIFPTLSWSRSGARENTSNTSCFAFCTPHPLSRLLLAEWVASLLFTGLVFSGAGLNFLFQSDLLRLFALAAGIGLIPSAALALGVWSGTSKVFEVSYLIVWYIGIANNYPGLDFLGTTPNAFIRQNPLAAAWLVLVLLAAAFVGRKRVIV